MIDNNSFLKNDTSNYIVSEAIASKANINFADLVLNENFLKRYTENMLIMLWER